MESATRFVGPLSTCSRLPPRRVRFFAGLYGRAGRSRFRKATTSSDETRDAVSGWMRRASHAATREFELTVRIGGLRSTIWVAPMGRWFGAVEFKRTSY